MPGLVLSKGSHLIPTTIPHSIHCSFSDERAEALSTGLVRITQESVMKLGSTADLCV